MLNKETIIEKLKDYTGGSVDLCYVDYSEELTPEQVNKIMQSGDVCKIWEDDCFYYSMADQEDEEIERIIKEALTFEEWEELNTNDNAEVYEEAREYLYSVNESDPIKDLLKNTRKLLFFYDFGIEIDRVSKDKDIVKEAKRIAKKIGLDYVKYEKELRELVVNAFCGGHLTALFCCKPSDIYAQINGEKKANTITFDKINLCIMDRFDGGSGHDVVINEKIVFPFVYSNLWVDSVAGGYSYDSVCGLYLPYYEQVPAITTEEKQKNDKTQAVKNSGDGQ